MHIHTWDEKTQMCKDPQTHTECVLGHVIPQECRDVCTFWFVLSVSCSPVCHAFGFKWCHFYSNHLPLCFCPSDFLVACLSIGGSVPQNDSHIRTEHLTASHSSPQLLGVSWRAGCSKFSPMSPSLFVYFFYLLYLCASSNFPPFLPLLSPPASEKHHSEHLSGFPTSPLTHFSLSLLSPNCFFS